MSPVAKAINLLQGESTIQMGWLLLKVTTFMVELEKTRVSLRFCKPLIGALQEKSLKKQFGKMMSDPDRVAAAILHPKLKTSPTSDEDILNLNIFHFYPCLSCIITYLLA